MAWSLTCWCILTTFRTVDFSLFGVILLLPDIFLWIQGRNGLKFGMLMYPDHLQNWLEFSHGLLIFLVLTSFSLSESMFNLGFLAIFFRTHESNGLVFDMLIYPDHLLNWLRFGDTLLIFFILVVFWLGERSQICSFRAFSWECMGGTDWNLPCWCILTTFRTYSSLVMVCRISLFFMSAPWFCANLIGHWHLRGATVIRSLDLIVHL